MKKLLLFVVLAAVAVGVYLGYERYQRASEDAAALTAPPSRDLTVESIRQKLQAGSFRDKLAAKRQIGELEPGERLRVLTVLLGEEAVSTRLLAVSGLSDLGGEEVEPLLARAAEEDSDETVRQAAQAALNSLAAPAETGSAEGAEAPAPTPAPAPAGGDE